MTQAPSMIPPTTPAKTPGSRRRRRLLVALTGTVLVLAGYTVYANTRPVQLSASIEIEASADEVWQVLTDLSAYPQWNPFITFSEVTSPDGLEEGARLRNVMHDDTGDTEFTPEVLTVAPGRELGWIGRLGPGWIFDGEHRFTIEEIGAGRVRLTQTERFTGAAVPFFKGRLEDQTLPQFRAMNEALAQRAEASHREP